MLVSKLSLACCSVLAHLHQRGTIALASQKESISRLVATEQALSLAYDGVPFSVMMASPQDLEDFAYGFSLTEGIISKADEIVSVQVQEQENSILVDIELLFDQSRKLRMRRRAIAGRSSCGLCGIQNIEHLLQASKSEIDEAIKPDTESIFRALDSLEKNQQLNAQTGAFHAAAFFDLCGCLKMVREDVGRHNALDKLIGALLRQGENAALGFIVVTSRASFEMVEKAAMFGARTLVAISAPTSLAIERAQLLGLTLAAIARQDSLLVFSGSLAQAP